MKVNETEEEKDEGGRSYSSAICGAEARSDRESVGLHIYAEQLDYTIQP